MYGTNPSSKFASVTLSDTAPNVKYQEISTGTGQNPIFLTRCRGISLGTSGNVAVKSENGDSITIYALASGIEHPISTHWILSTGTTATLITAYF